jgi:hypothetical protein
MEELQRWRQSYKEINGKTPTKKDTMALAPTAIKEAAGIRKSPRKKRKLELTLKPPTVDDTHIAKKPKVTTADIDAEQSQSTPSLERLAPDNLFLSPTKDWKSLAKGKSPRKNSNLKLLLTPSPRKSVGSREFCRNIHVLLKTPEKTPTADEEETPFPDEKPEDVVEKKIVKKTARKIYKKGNKENYVKINLRKRSYVKGKKNNKKFFKNRFKKRK